MSLRKSVSVIGIVVAISLIVYIIWGFLGSNNDVSNESQNISMRDASGDMGSDSEEAVSSADGAQVEIVDSGFGQDSNSARAVVIAKSSGGSLTGEFVTATVNFLDESGAILATEERVEGLDWEGQELALPVFHYKEDPNSPEIASIEAFLSVSDFGLSQSDKTVLPVLETTEISNPYIDSYTASFGFKNDSAEDFKNLRVSVACYNEHADIIGGGDVYPTLVPAGGSIRMDAIVTVSEMPASCKAYVGH